MQQSCFFFLMIISTWSQSLGLDSTPTSAQDWERYSAEVWKRYYQLEDSIALSMSDSLLGVLPEYKLQILNLRGYLLLNTGRIDSAVGIHSYVQRTAVEADLEDVFFATRYYLAAVKGKSRRYHEGIDLINEALSYFISRPEIDSALVGRLYQARAEMQLASGESSDARNSVTLAGNYYGGQILIRNSSFSMLQGEIASSRNKHEEALEHYLSALQTFERYGRLRQKVYLLTKISSSYFLLGKIDRAGRYMDRSLNLATHTGLTKDLVLAYTNASLLLESQFRYREALIFLQRKDSLLQLENTRENVSQMVRANKVLDQNLSEIAIRNLEQQIEDKQGSIDRQRVLIFIVVLICFYLLGSVIVFRRLIKKRKRNMGLLDRKDAQIRQKEDQVSAAQDRLIKSEKMALLGRISAGIAHELNTPVGAMKANLELVHDVQQRELNLFQSIKEKVTKKDLGLWVKMIEDGSKNVDRILSRKEEEQIREEWKKMLESNDVNKATDIAELAVELKLENQIDLYLPLCEHEDAGALFELALYITNRYQSVQAALEATRRVQKILGSFKTYSFKHGWESYEKVDLRSSLEAIISLHQNILRKINLDFEVEPGIEVSGIADELGQVWTNLISNAAYAMDYAGRFRIAAFTGDDRVMLEFEDSGGGIHMDDPERIFDPFFTTKPQGEGSGIGLDISRQIIDKHNGSITFENTNTGVKFIVILPLPDSNNSL